MLDKMSAMELVSRSLSEMEIPGDRLVVVDERTIEREFGWIFFYDAEKYLKTKQPIYAIAGNGPVFVNRRTGLIKFGGSGEPLEKQISDYEKNPDLR